MFEYDRLALDVAQQVAQFKSPDYDSTQQHFTESKIRRCSTGSSGGTATFSDSGYDCGSSSGYGSPGSGGTPMASPAPNSYLTSGLLSHVVGYMCDAGFCDESIMTQQTVPPRPPKSHFNSMTTQTVSIGEGAKVNDENSPDRDDDDASNAPVAVDDGFSNDEIAQFAQLLCSPKKAPPNKYQCHICYQTGHYISDCPMRFNSPYEELTPYQGRKKCYGEFQCQQCKRKWTSQNSVANEAQSCIKCHVPVFPHKQLPVDKAVALGLVKAQRVLPTKLAPIGHGRPPFNANRQ